MQKIRIRATRPVALAAADIAVGTGEQDLR
jgi:hypothetical protein